MASLENYVGGEVLVITQDGRVICGTLKGYDQTTNVILANCHERLFSSTSPVEKVELGLYIIRGDNIAMVGKIDPELDKEIKFEELIAAPLQPVIY